MLTEGFPDSGTRYLRARRAAAKVVAEEKTWSWKLEAMQRQKKFTWPIDVLRNG